MSKLRQRGRRRGMSLVEVMVAGTITVWIVSLLIGMANFHSRVWQGGMSDGASQMSGQLALQRMGPTVRTARRVDVAKSSATKLTVQLPKYDGSGNLIIPIENGDVVTFYLSNTTGNEDVSGGTILWRKVNGVADKGWSLQNGKGRIVVAKEKGLNFTYYPTADPESVTMSLKTTNTTGTDTSYFETSQEFLLRNRL